MILKIKLDSTITSIDIYNTTRFMLEDYYNKYDINNQYVDFIQIDSFIKYSYINSMFDNLINLCDALGISFSIDDIIVISNIIYRLKGLRESLEYFFNDVIKCQFNLTYDYIDYIWSAEFNNLSISNLTKFNIYLNKMVNELYYTKSQDSNIMNINLDINIEKILSYGISQTYFNDFKLIKI